MAGFSKPLTASAWSRITSAGRRVRGERARVSLRGSLSRCSGLEAAERRLESLGVDAVALQVRASGGGEGGVKYLCCWQRFNALEVDKENELAAFGERITAATASLLTLRDTASLSLRDAKERNEQAAPLANAPAF